MSKFASLSIILSATRPITDKFKVRGPHGFSEAKEKVESLSDWSMADLTKEVNALVGDAEKQLEFRAIHPAEFARGHRWGQDGQSIVEKTVEAVNGLNSEAERMAFAAGIAGSRPTDIKEDVVPFPQKKSPITAAAIVKKFDRDEDRNAHCENGLLFAKLFGTPDEIEAMKRLVKKANAGGGFAGNEPDYLKRQEIFAKYDADFEKLRHGGPVPARFLKEAGVRDGNRVRAGSLYKFQPTGMDLAHPVSSSGHKMTFAEPGQIVRVVNLPSAPKANTMGQCHIEDPKTKEFLGMVSTASLTPVNGVQEVSGVANAQVGLGEDDFSDYAKDAPARDRKCSVGCGGSGDSVSGMCRDCEREFGTNPMLNAVNKNAKARSVNIKREPGSSVVTTTQHGMKEADEADDWRRPGLKDRDVMPEFPSKDIGDAPKGQVGGPRSLYDIAQDIRKNWRPINYAAAPYLSAMMGLDKITDHYGMDDARSIVLYFLSNATTWRGPEAQRVKAELKGMLNPKAAKKSTQRSMFEASLTSEDEPEEAPEIVKVPVNGLQVGDRLIASKRVVTSLGAPGKKRVVNTQRDGETKPVSNSWWGTTVIQVSRPKKVTNGPTTDVAKRFGFAPKTTTQAGMNPKPMTTTQSGGGIYGPFYPGGPKVTPGHYDGD